MHDLGVLPLHASARAHLARAAILQLSLSAQALCVASCAYCQRLCYLVGGGGAGVARINQGLGEKMNVSRAQGRHAHTRVCVPSLLSSLDRVDRKLPLGLLAQAIR